jgi:hypothetical protein
MQTKSKHALGNVIFLVGMFIGLGMAIAAVWGDFEGMSYFYNGAGYDSFGGLICPVLMSRSDVSSVSASFDNPTDQEIKPYYKVNVSGRSTLRQIEDQVTVPAHGSRSVEWTVDANDIDLGYFIIMKMDVLPVAGYSTREATCGIIVLSLMGLTGGQIFGWALAASLLGIVLGLGLRESGNEIATGKALSFRNGMRAAGVAVSLAMLTGFVGSWLIGIVFCAISILLLIILLQFAAA